MILDQFIDGSSALAAYNAGLKAVARVMAFPLFAKLEGTWSV
jgi:hypothetical protein